MARLNGDLKFSSENDEPEPITKLGLVAAAETMSKSAHTLKAYLAAWNKAAADGLCVPSTDLNPEDGASAYLAVVIGHWTCPQPTDPHAGQGCGEPPQRP